MLYLLNDFLVIIKYIWTRKTVNGSNRDYQCV